MRALSVTLLCLMHIAAFAQAPMPIVKEGKSPDDTATSLREEFRNKYPDWDQPLRIHAAATATAIYRELP